MSVVDDDDRPTFPDDVAAQHAHLARLLVELRERASHGATGGDLCKLLDSLATDVADHFAAEEKLMERGGYPHLDQHREQHAKFLSHIETLTRDCAQRTAGLHRSIIQQLEDWYHDHQHTADAEALRFLGVGRPS
jgi:hemerythrin